MDQLIASLPDYLQTWAPLVIEALKALFVIVFGWIVSGALGRFVRRRVEASARLDDTIGAFAASIIRWLVLLITLIAVLNLFGIQATSLVAMLGAATLAIGMALQGTLADLAAGFMIILFRPYRIGHYVTVSGTSGTVKDINLFFTEMATPDNVQIIVPNGKAWGQIITNFSFHETRRVDLTFGIGYGDDANHAMKIVRTLAEADGRVMADPEPWLRVTGLGDSAVEITARLWVAATDYQDVKSALMQAVKERFGAEGISIPYPTQTVVQSGFQGGD